MVKLYSDRAVIHGGGGHVVMLSAFWGNNPEDPNDPTSGRYDRYVEQGARFFELTTLEAADVAVFPGAWERVKASADGRERAAQFVDKARRAGKRTVIFFWSDSIEDIPFEDVLVLRTSFYASRRKPHEYAMPSWSEDFVSRYLEGRLPIRRKADRPTVGFCGYAGPRTQSMYERVRKLARAGAVRLRLQPPQRVSGPLLRARALEVLSKSHQVRTNFVVRDEFLGGVWRPDGSQDLLRCQQVRREYVDNMVGSDYVLCMRGGGNFSYRLYETLSCGRIPLFVNTDCVLPYDFDVDWKKHCVWVEQVDMDAIAERVADFHAALSDADFRDLQYECRRLWDDRLSPHGFFRHFHRHLSR